MNEQNLTPEQLDELMDNILEENIEAFEELAK